MAHRAWDAKVSVGPRSQVARQRSAKPLYAGAIPAVASMEWHSALGILGGIVYNIGYIPYVLQILKGKTRPNLLSWVGWFFLLVIGSSAQLAGGATWSVALPIAAAIGCGITTLVAFRYGYATF